MLHANIYIDIKTSDVFAFLPNSLENHVNLAELPMVEPEKFMVGYRP